MSRLLLRLALLTAGALAVTLLLIHLRGYDATTVDSFFAPQSCSAMPCWQGIRPGETTDEQALAILHAHPWVENVSEVTASPGVGAARTVLIYWSWSKDYPFAGSQTPPSQEGIIIVRGGIVTQIYLTTDLLFGDMWLAFGGPNDGTVDYVADANRLRVDNTALYARSSLAATASLFADCDAPSPDYWRTPVYLWLQDRPASALDQIAFQAYLNSMRTGFQRIRGTFC